MPHFGEPRIGGAKGIFGYLIERENNDYNVYDQRGRLVFSTAAGVGTASNWAIAQLGNRRGRLFYKAINGVYGVDTKIIVPRGIQLIGEAYGWEATEPLATKGDVIFSRVVAGAMVSLTAQGAGVERIQFDGVNKSGTGIETTVAAKDGHIIDCSFYNLGIGIDLLGMNWWIERNWVEENSVWGIKVRSSLTRIYNNTLGLNGTGAGTGANILIDSAESSIPIIGNTFFGAAGKGSNYSVRVGNHAVTKVACIGNIHNGLLVDCYHILGAVTDFKIDDALADGAGVTGNFVELNNAGAKVVVRDTPVRNFAAAIFNPVAGVLDVQGCEGFNPQAAAVPAVPASPATFGPYIYPMYIEVAGGAGVGITVRGQATTLVEGMWLLYPGDTMVITYTGAPTVTTWPQ